MSDVEVRKKEIEVLKKRFDTFFEELMKKLKENKTFTREWRVRFKGDKSAVLTYEDNTNLIEIEARIIDEGPDAYKYEAEAYYINYADKLNNPRERVIWSRVRAVGGRGGARVEPDIVYEESYDELEDEMKEEFYRGMILRARSASYEDVINALNNIMLYYQYLKEDEKRLSKILTDEALGRAGYFLVVKKKS